MVLKTKHFLPAAEGFGLLGYETLDAFYRDVREGNLASHYYERRGKRIFISARALGLIPPTNENRGDEPQTEEGGIRESPTSLRDSRSR